MTQDHVVIVGAGFTGTLLAINLLGHDGPPATLIERRPGTARGVAYSTAHPEHVLNVRAANMSALPDDPGHFARWLEAGGLGKGDGFAPRRVYGDYLDALLADAVARAGGRLRVVQGEAVDVAPDATGATVRLADGGTVRAGTVALAPGNLPPLVPRGLDPEALPEGCYVTDPWRGDLAAGLGPDATVLVLGTGLTMVDVALLLDAHGFRGRVVALSRRGLLPHAHAAVPPFDARSERPPPQPTALLRDVRARADAIGWRAAVDELRPFTQGLWRAMDAEGQRRFLRHLRPWWDVHRHRIAPTVAQRLDRMRAEGRLEIAAGRLLGARREGARAAVRYAPRGEGSERVIAADRIVNATGPQGDLTRSAEPLLRALHARGLVRPDALRIGVDVDQDSRAIDAEGRVLPWLFVLGPPTRGAFWEIVAVPDIRRQVWSVARQLANAHWVEGEGL